MQIFRIVIETAGSHEDCSGEAAFYVETNAASPADLKAAYEAGARRIGVDIQKILADGRGSSEAYGLLTRSFDTIQPFLAEGDLDMSVAPKLMKWFGRRDFAKDASLEPDEYEDDFVIDTPEYFLLWRAIARVGNPDLVLRGTDKSLDVEIGGSRWDFTS